MKRGVADEVRSPLAELLEKDQVGNGHNPNTSMGPLMDKPNVARVTGVVKAALAYSKAVLRGGPVPEGDLALGSFYRPSLLEVDDVSSDIVQRRWGPRSPPLSCWTPRPMPL